MQKKIIVKSLKAILAIILGVVFVFPIIILVISSFKPNSEVFALSLIPSRFTFEGYRFALQENLWRYFLNSMIIASTVTVVALIFHAMAGYALARINFRGNKFAFNAILSTLMIPFSVILIPLFILVKEFNWLNTFYGVIIPAIPHAYGIFLFKQFYETIPEELMEAAKIDGCKPHQIFLKIFVPLSKPITITLAVAFFIANWNNYLWPLIVNQERDMWVIQVKIASFIGRSDTPWNAILASGVITILPIMIMFFFLQKYLVEGIKMSGIK